MCTKLFSLLPSPVPSFSLLPSVPLVALSMSQRQTKPRTSYAGRIIVEDPFFGLEGWARATLDVPTKSVPELIPRWSPSRPRRRGGLRNRGLWDALGMLNAQMCNCIVKWKNLPRDVDGTIMGQIIISSTPRGGGRRSPHVSDVSLP